MRVISLDPGGTTGYAVWSDDFTDVGQIGPGAHHLNLWWKLRDVQPDVIVCERFVYQRRDLDKGVSLSLVSVEYIGVLKLWCENYQTTRFIEQTPAQAKNLWTDDKLKNLGLWQANAPHAMDAVRHMLYFVTFGLDRKDYIMRLNPRH